MEGWVDSRAWEQKLKITESRAGYTHTTHTHNPIMDFSIVSVDAALSPVTLEYSDV